MVLHSQEFILQTWNYTFTTHEKTLTST